MLSDAQRERDQLLCLAGEGAITSCGHRQCVEPLQDFGRVCAQPRHRGGNRAGDFPISLAHVTYRLQEASPTLDIQICALSLDWVWLCFHAGSHTMLKRSNDHDVGQVIVNSNWCARLP